MKYKNQEDKPTYLLFWETALKPCLKFLGVIGTTITRSFRELFWTFAGLMILNTFLETKIILKTPLIVIMCFGVSIYNYHICKRSMRYS